MVCVCGVYVCCNPALGCQNPINHIISYVSRKKVDYFNHVYRCNYEELARDVSCGGTAAIAANYDSTSISTPE